MANILIVDDSIVMRKNLSSILIGAGHSIVGEATNGRQAIALYQELKPDLVTMDISMPILGGVDAVKRIIKDDPNAKIVMISAVNQKKMVFNALNSGAKHYIIKPIEQKKVIGVINEVLESTNEGKSFEELGSQVQGFEIENIDGAFVIKFNNHLGIKDHNLLDMALRGIMFVKPLRVVMDFMKCDVLDDSVVTPIIDMAKNIKDAEGDVVFKSEDSNLINKLKAW